LTGADKNLCIGRTLTSNWRTNTDLEVNVHSRMNHVTNLCPKVAKIKVKKIGEIESDL
jgi:hypothetical protein